ncbi:hypothetical protein [Xanthomonas theicola]|uniref:hypothetical protein n=1 Tax=Xanthomonas theicola TaxID=56464 RepID=UPI001B8036B6|nr:hypothetical protein [Xanthomonas theicola]
MQGAGGDLRLRDPPPGVHRPGDIHASRRARPGRRPIRLGLWIVNAYAIAFGGCVCVMAAGAIGDQIGRKRCFAAAPWIFIATSLLIGLAPNLLLLNLLRAAEGVGGGGDRVQLHRSACLCAGLVHRHPGTRCVHGRPCDPSADRTDAGGAAAGRAEGPARFAGLLSGIGFLVCALGAWRLMRLSPEGSLWSMAIPMLLIGIGNGLPWGLMDALWVSVVPKERAGMAAGIFTAMPVAGEAIAIAAIGAVLVGLTAANLRAAAQADSLSLPQSATAIASRIGASAKHGFSTGGVSAMDAAIIKLAHDAYTSAFHGIFGVLAVLSTMTAVVCVATLRQWVDRQGTAQEP